MEECLKVGGSNLPCCPRPTVPRACPWYLPSVIVSLLDLWEPLGETWRDGKRHGLRA